MLIEAEAPLDVIDRVHESSPIGWAVHGSRYSGDAAKRREAYVELVKILLAAGSRLDYPDDTRGSNHFERFVKDSSPEVQEVLEAERRK